MAKQKRLSQKKQSIISGKLLLFSLVALALIVGLARGLVSTPKTGSPPAVEPPLDRELAQQMRNPYKVDKEFLNAGKGIYQEKCLSCHLADGSGSPEHPLKVHAPHHTPGDYLWVVTYGLEEYGIKEMKGYKDELSLLERWQVVGYIRQGLVGLSE